MTTPEHLANAPIVEAVLDIIVDFKGSPTLEHLAAFEARIAKRYAQKQVKVAWQGQLTIKGKDAPRLEEPKGGPVGYLFRNTDGNEVVQARRDGFAFSRLRPYQSWDTFRSEAQRLWDLYRVHTKPEKILRVGLRYINRFVLPEPAPELMTYLATLPQIAPELPQVMDTFFFRVVIPNAEGGFTIIISETADKPTGREEGVPIILDVDVFSRVPYPLQGDKLWNSVERMREIKNRVFFSSITDATKELFK